MNKNFGKFDATRYNKAMSKLIEKNKGLPIQDTLIDLLEEASKWKLTNKKEKKMKITDFALEVAKTEGKKVEVNIAQIKEVLKVVNELTNGELYKLIRKS